MIADRIIYASRLATCAPGNSPRAASDAKQVGLIEDAALAVRDGRVIWVGERRDVPPDLKAVESYEYPHQCIIPGLVDAHTHPVWGGSRVQEFVMRGEGAAYLDILKAGGGILSTVRATRALSTEQLLARTRRVFERMLIHGTTTIEAKSGYSLDTETELRDLRAIRAAAADMPLRVVSTFLGAHAVPPEFSDNRDAFVDLVVQEMLPRVAGEALADFCDVFCDDGAFTLQESRRILEEARKLGLRVKIHAEEFAYTGSARMAAALGATSVDHLLSLPADDFSALRDSGTVAVLLPGTSFFLGTGSYAPARGLIDSGVPVAIATDFNAGSCMTESLPAALSLAVLKMGVLPEEALTAATVNAAHAVGRGGECGSLEVGRQADFLVLDVADLREWLYHFGTNLVAEVWTAGQRRVATAWPSVLQ